MVKTSCLNNGIVFVGEENEFVRTNSIGIWIKNGSVDEDEQTNGISHFIEHMLFKGTANRTAKDIADQMSAIGGRINAFTGKEYMCYYAHVLDTHFDKALDILSDMICNSVFNEEDIRKEKGVILEELKMSLDTPEDIINESLQLEVFNNSALSYNILGIEDNIKKFNREDILNYFNKHYVSSNIVISVVGKIDYDVVYDKLNEKFKSIQKGTSQTRSESTAYSKAFIMNNKDIEQVHLLFAFPSFKAESPEMYAVSIINSIIGGGMNSRLFQRIREEEGLVYSVYSYQESFVNSGLFNIYAATTSSSLEQVIEMIYEELNILIEQGIDEEELMMTKEQLKSNLIIGLESMNARMSTYGKSKLMLDRIKSQDEIILNLNKIDIESINSILKQIINYDALSVSIVGKQEEINQERIRELCNH